MVWVYINLILLPVTAIEGNENIEIKNIKEDNLDIGKWARITPLNLDKEPEKEKTTNSFLFTYFSLLGLTSLSLFKNRKKAQVTLFIIIGAILILSITGFFYIRNITAKQKTGEEIIRKIEVPTEVSPIKNFVENCMEQIGLEALELIESQGGYINTDYFNYLIPTEGNAVEFSSGFIVPYWYYMKSRDTCTSGCEFASEMPNLCRTQGLVQRQNCIKSGDNSIEEDIDNYIKTHLDSCLDGFQEFKKQGYEIEELENLTVTTTIRGKDMVFTLHYPLNILKDETSIDMEYFQKVITSDLSEMYKTAFELTNYESQNCFLESQTTNYVSYFMGLDEGKLPPISEMTIGEYGMHWWLLPQVEPILRNKIYNAMQLIRVYNTSSFSWPTTTTAPDDPYYMTDQGTLNQYVFYPLSEYHNRTSINFFYHPLLDSYKPYLEIKPSEGALLLPTNIEGPQLDGLAGAITAVVSMITGIKEYEFSYQYSFPVIVEIRKTDNKGEEHVFRFALESNIRANACFGPSSSIAYSTGFGGLSCDMDMWTRNVTLYLTDNETGDNLEDASVYFYTGDSTCLLGLTNESGKLTTNYPSMFGGFFDFRKQGYLRKMVHEPDITHPMFETTLKLFRTKNISIKLINESLKDEISQTGDTIQKDILRSNAPGPSPNDTIMIELIRIPGSLEEPEYSTMILYDDGELMQDTVDLLPGKYNISISLFTNQEISIKEEHDRICEGGCCYRIPINDTCGPRRGQTQEDFEASDCYIEGYKCGTRLQAIAANVPDAGGINLVCGIGRRCVNEDGDRGDYEGIPFDYEEFNLSMFPNGGAILNEWNLVDYQLNSGDDITFYLFRQNSPSRQHHLREMTFYINYSNDYPYMIMPEIS